jgi:hypothetical protein
MQCWVQCSAVQCRVMPLLIMREYKVQGPVHCSAFIDTWDSIQCWVQCSAVPSLIMRQHKVLGAVQCTVPSLIHETVYSAGCSAVHSAFGDTWDSIQCWVQCSAQCLRWYMRQYTVLGAVQCSAVHSAISDTRDSTQCKVPSVIHETPNNPVTCQEHIYSY